MNNIYFPDEDITFNDLYFVCYMIERVARNIKQRNRSVVERIGSAGLAHQLSIAETSHCLNPEQVVDDWKEEYALSEGDVDVTIVEREYTDKNPFYHPNGDGLCPPDRFYFKARSGFGANDPECLRLSNL